MKKVTLGPETLLFPMPAVLVGATVEGKPNFMTAAWCGIASSQPPALSVAIRPQRYTYKGIVENRNFSINVPSADMAQDVDYCGIYSGRKKDKSQRFESFYGTLKTAPLIQECPVNLECKVIHTLELGTHHLVIGQITDTFIDDDCLKDGKADAVKIDPLVYSPGATQYQRLGEVIGKAFNIGREKERR